MRIEPARRIHGYLSLPGDKSISHRAAILAALALGRSRINNFSTSRDCAATLGCLRHLGVHIEMDGTSLEVTGTRPVGFSEPKSALDCGNSGSTMRLLAGVLACQQFTSSLTGDESLRARPMKRVIEPLTEMGARISAEDNHAPLVIRGRERLKAISYRMEIASAQVKSCVLLAGLSAEGRTEVFEQGGPTRDHTERMLRLFGVSVQTRSLAEDGQDSRVVAIDGPARFSARTLAIPGDISSAAFFIAAAALIPGSSLHIGGVGLNPTRTLFLKTLRRFGAQIRAVEIHEECNEPVGDLHVRGGAARGLIEDEELKTVRGSLIPQMIDELPLLAVIGTQVRGGIRIHDAQELRVKESDRIAATVENLRRMGAAVDEFDDGLAVLGPTRLEGAQLDSFGDHRIAMAFTTAALIARSPSEIVGAEECVAVSFPEFFQLLEAVVE